MTPVAVVAWSYRSLLTEERKPEALKARTLAVMAWAHTQGLPLYPLKGTTDYFFASALRILKLRGILVEAEGLLRPASEKGALLDYYAKSVEHHLQGFPE